MKRLRNLLLLLCATSAFAQLGTVTNVTPPITQPGNTCPAGFSPGFKCYHAVVTGCANVSDVGLTFGIKKGTQGTIILFSGAGGNKPTGTFAPNYSSPRAGFTVVDTMWDGVGWKQTGTGNPKDLKAASCRPASFRNYIFQSFGAPLCLQGSSTGASAIGYDLSFWGGDLQVSNIELLSGPVMSDITKGCEKPLSDPVTIVPTKGFGLPFTVNPQYVGSQRLSITNSTGHTCLPTSGDTSQSDNDAWTAQSVVQPGIGSYNHQKTTQAAYVCTNGQNNSAPEAQFYVTALMDQGSPMILSGVDNCRQAEDVQDGTINGMPAKPIIVNHMVTSCVIHTNIEIQ